MSPGSARLVLAVFVLATAVTLAQEDAGRPKPPASMLPPAPFVDPDTPTPSSPYKNLTTTPIPQNTTTAHVTTAPPHNTTTAHITTAPPHNTTTAHVTTAPPHNTTTAHVTTAPPHNTTTANVTTAPPHNTTTANVTTAPPHNTTTANVTTAAPTTIPGPTPTANITVGNYTVKDGNTLCIMVQAAIQVRVNNSQMAGTYIVPGNAISTGNCQSNAATLKITFNEGYVSMNFAKNDTTKMVFVSAVAVNLTYAFKSGVLSTLDKKNESVQLFSMATSHSYSCKSESVFMGNGVYLDFNKDRMQAFNFTNNQFGTTDLCKADQPDYRVAIGVGVVLLILIIIVVVAYLLSRRRRTDGYQTL